MPFYESQPTIYPLYRLLEEVLRGEIGVPRFQRPGTETTWKPEQRGDLLDSVHRGFPIGTILLWSTTEPVKTLNNVGGALIPAPPEHQRLRLVLDGHQRLSTLISILGPGLKCHPEPGTVPEEQWAFDISDDKEMKARGRFLLVKRGDELEEAMLPLHIVFDRVLLNKWLRERKNLTEREIARADAVRDSFREYSLPVAALVTESLDEATESFHRINSSGTPMDSFHMVTALAYAPEFDPQERFELVSSKFLEPEGWGDLGNIVLLRVAAGLVRLRLDKASQHPAKLNIRGLAETLQAQPELIERTGQALMKACQVLRTFGVHGPAVLPYVWQLIILAIEVGTRDKVRFKRSEHKILERWFWLTTYGEVFAGANPAVVDRAMVALRDMLGGGDDSAMRRDTSRQVGQPTRFDFRSARSRGLMLQMARVSDGASTDGPAHLALALGTQSVATLVPKLAKSIWYNRAIEPDMERLTDLRCALRAQARGESQELHGISIHADDEGDVDELLEARRKRLIALERKFVEALGLSWRET